MRIIKECGGYTLPGETGLALGYFDGVHLGHAALINRAKQNRKYAAVRIFESIPRKAGLLLTTLDEKLERFERLGVDIVIIDDFSAMRDMSGVEFFDRCVKRLAPSSVVCGYNYHFGKKAGCSAGDMLVFAKSSGIECTVLPEFTVDGRTVSSTEVRALLGEGRTLEAARLLGRMYSVREKICHGRELGRTIGFPTVNQRPPSYKALPMDGIYSCTAEFYSGGERLTKGGVCNIGSRPTVNRDENDVTLETYIFDYSGDLYSKEVKISFVERLRGEVRFSSVTELREAIKRDAEHSRESLAKYTDIYK